MASSTSALEKSEPPVVRECESSTTSDSTIPDDQLEHPDNHHHHHHNNNNSDNDNNNNNNNSNNNDEGNRPIVGWRWYLLALALLSFSFLTGLDATVVADIQGVVVEAFGQVEQLVWVGAGYQLGSVAVLLATGALYGSFNMKWLFLVACLLFEVGSTLCGAAPNMLCLIVGRIAAGAGGCGIYLGSLNYFTYLTTREERGTYMAALGFSYGVGSVLGPIVGGLFSVSRATWRFSFYINLVLGAVVVPVYLLLLPPLRAGPKASFWKRIRELDLVGFLLSAAVWISLTLGLTIPGNQWRWDDPGSIALFVVFGVTLPLFAVQQAFFIFTTPANRAFPCHLLRRQMPLLAAGVGSATALFVMIYYGTLYFQFVRNDSALETAVHLLPYVAITFVINLATGWLLGLIGSHVPIYIASGVFLTVGGALLFMLMGPDATDAAVYGIMSLTALGTALTLQIGYTVATLQAAAEDVGNAVLLQNVSQIGGSVIAPVVAGQVFRNSAIPNLERLLLPLGYSHEDVVEALSGLQSNAIKGLSGDVRGQVVYVIASALCNTFAMVIAVGGLMIVSTLFMDMAKLRVLTGWRRKDSLG